jgi:hypothetical protein
MEMNEEELQRSIEAGERHTGEDAVAYRRIFDALEREPGFGLSVNFADAVMDRIETKRESRKEYFLIGGGVLFFIVAAVVVFFVSGFTFSPEAFRLQTDLSAFRFVKDYTGLVFFGIAFVAFLQWADRRFIRPLTKANDLSL